MMAAAVNVSWRTITCAGAPCSPAPRVANWILAGAFVLTSPPCFSRYSRAGTTYSSSSGFNGSAIEASRGLVPSISASERSNGPAEAASIDSFSAATASGSHSISTSRGVWWCLISHWRTVSSGRPVKGGPVPMRIAAMRSRHDNARQVITPASRFSGGGSRGHLRRDERPLRSIMSTVRRSWTST